MPGRCHDSNIFEQSALKMKLQNGMLNSFSKNMFGVDVPVVVLGDSAFRLAENVMKPYAFSTTASTQQKNFNYALSKCRRVVESAFGHLKGRFRRIGKGIDNWMVNVNTIIKCACVLHNYLNARNSKINQCWIEEQTQFENVHLAPSTQEQIFLADFNPSAEQIRTSLAKYICKF